MSKHARMQVYRGRDGLWYRRLIAGNGRIVDIGGEGFQTESNAKRSVKSLVRWVLESSKWPVEGQGGRT